MVNLKNAPLSGDEIVDWIFKQFIRFLNRKTVYIIRKKRLKDSGGQILLGFTMPKDPSNYRRGTYIFINHSKCRHHNRDEETESLIHELCHNIFSDAGERYIGQLEKKLIKKFTATQKRVLKSFLPHGEFKS